MLQDNDIMTIASLLSRLQPGYLPEPIFQQFARLCALPVLELVPLRKTDSGVVEVLLIERPVTDEIWAGELHVPGTVVRASDTAGTFHSIFTRLLQDELAGTPTDAPQFVTNILNRSKRGAEYSQIYWVKVTGEPVIGKFYDASHLPDTTVKSQLAFIHQAVASFKNAIHS